MLKNGMEASSFCKVNWFWVIQCQNGYFDPLLKTKNKQQLQKWNMWDIQSTSNENV